MPCFVVQYDLKRIGDLVAHLEEHGFALTKPEHTLVQGKKKGLSCTLYTSGKLVVQGKGTDEYVKYTLEPELLGTFTFGYEDAEADLTARIGVDESGKGDFFGPLCVAGVYADGDSIIKLRELGVKDSKQLRDSSILKIAEKIRKHYLYHIVRISPKKYNELYESFGNLNLLLGWGHATVIENLIDKVDCTYVIIDKFAAEHVVENALKKKKKQVALTQRTKGEQDLVVAAASILARAAFVEGLSRLEEEYGEKLPKGASAATIAAGRRLVGIHGPHVLEKVAKLHFKTRAEVLK